MHKINAYLFNKLVNPETGKFKFVSPNAAKKIAYAGGVTFIVVLLISQLLNQDKLRNRSFDDYQKEITSDGGTTARDQSNQTIFDKDPLSGLKLSPGNSIESVDINASPGNGGSDSYGREKVAMPSASECYTVIEKAKSGSILALSEKNNLSSCVENNVVPIPENEREALKALSSSDLSDKERQAVLDSIKGKSDSKLSDVIAASVNPIKQNIIKDGVNRELQPDGIQIDNGEVRGMSKTMADKPDSFGKAIDGTNKIVNGQRPDEKEKANIVDVIREVKGGAEAALENTNLSPDKEKALQNLIEDIQARDDKLGGLKQQLAEVQAAARPAAEALSSGKALSSQEQASIDKLSSLRKEIDNLQGALEKRQRSLIELTSRLQKTVAMATAAITKTIPSGVFESYADFEPLDCKKIKALPVRVAKKSPKQISIAEANDSNGKNGKGLKFSPKKGLNIYKREDFASNNGMQLDGKRLDISKYLNDQKIALNELFVVKGTNDKTTTLAPELKIAAVLDSEILVAANASQVVRVKVIQDVYDAKTQQLIIPKGSLAVGKTGSFDENTGLMEISLNKVSVGGGDSLSISVRVGSGDGNLGLRGKVYDSRGRYLVGAFITSFAAGALNFFTQNTVSQYQQSTNAATALTGAAYGGGADVMQKIATQLAGQLQNSPSVFFAPRQLPIILFPN